MKLNILFFALITLFAVELTYAQKKALSPESYSEWRSVNQSTISEDGKYVFYRYSYNNNDKANEEITSTFYLFNASTKKTRVLNNISNPKFSNKGKWLMYDVKYKDGVVAHKLMKLSSGKVINWNKKQLPNFINEKNMVSYSINKGNDLVILNLDNNESFTLKGAKRAEFFDDGSKMIYLRKDGSTTNLCYGNVSKSAKHTTLFKDTTNTLKFFRFSPISKEGRFEIEREINGKAALNSIYNFDVKDNQTEILFDSKVIAIDEPYILDSKSANIHENKNFITFKAFNSKPLPKKKYNKEDKNYKFELELWSWNDSIAQSIQAVDGYRESKPNADVIVYNAKTNRSYPILKGDEYNSMYISNNKDAEVVFFINENKYNRLREWEHDTRFDLSSVNLITGEKTIIKERATRKPEFSPNGDYLIYFDSQEKGWIAVDVISLKKRNISKDIKFPMHNESYDRPNPVPSYGLVGWDKDDKVMLVYDKYDIWAIDATGKNKPYCYTKGYGRKNNYRVRFLNVNYSTIDVDLSKNNMLEIVNLSTMDQIVATIHPSGNITKNVEGAFNIRINNRVNNGNTLLYIKQTFNQGRDIWISDSKFKKEYKITTANPQQENYRWGSVELVEWKNYDGSINKGLLYLPDGYTKGDSYPTIVNFYERHTGGMHIYFAPGYSSAMLDLSTYVSNGYIIFMPDVNFTIGSPGKSSYNSVVSGTKALIERGVIDPKRVGIQGHSWSGYQTSYLVTKTDIFTCASIGAPITNMTAAYNGVREGSGLPRMFMYEDWQCRMGTTMWKSLDKFIESSPILAADKIKTPIMLLHCDEDEAVSFYEGRSLALALRRLKVPSWMLNYKGEGHFVQNHEAQVDWTKRMRQFFDHYLNNTKMPRWMSEGINVNERGYDQKYNLTEDK